MANTTNLNLVKVDGSNKLKNFPTPYNENLEKIDEFAGTKAIIYEDATLTFANGVAPVSAKSGYTLMNVIARNRNDSSYSPIGITAQTDGSYKVNAVQSFNAGLQCRLFWLKT